MTSGYDYKLDVSGLLCPEPLMKVRNKVRSMAAGEVLFVLATDPTTERDFARFCQFLGHEMLAAEKQDGCYRYRIRKGR